MKQNLEEKSLAHIIFEHVEREDHDGLEYLLSVTQLKIRGDDEDDLQPALYLLGSQDRPDLAKKVISKIDLKTFTKEQNFDLLWGIGNNRFAEIFNHMIDHGFDPTLALKGKDVFYQVTKQSVISKQDPLYLADYSMVKKLLETGKVKGFEDEKDIKEALSKLEIHGPKSLNREVIKNDSLESLQEAKRKISDSKVASGIEKQPSTNFNLKPESQNGALLAAESLKNKGICSNSCITS